MRRIALLLTALMIFCEMAEAADNVASKKKQDDLNMAAGWDEDIISLKQLEKPLREWQDQAFGIFIHFNASQYYQGRYEDQELTKDLWGEWMLKRAEIPVEKFEQDIANWNPKDMSAVEWLDFVEASGFKYIIYVAKHHDGFAMFDDKSSDYSITKHTPFGRDPYKELCDEAHKRGVKIGHYYSHQVDWRNKSVDNKFTREQEDAYFEKVVRPHLTQLNTEYGEQQVVWFDLGWKNRPDLAKECENIVRTYNPNAIISSRIGGARGNYASQGDVYVPHVVLDIPWETPMTFNDHWAYTPSDDTHKNAKDIITMLSKIRSRGGNLLLNIGADYRGRVPLREQITLRQVGAWLETNKEAIYGAGSTPYGDLPWGVCTQKDGKLYLHISTLPTLDYIFLPGLNNKIKKAYFLDDKEPLKFEQSKGGWNIDLNGSRKLPFHNDVNVIAVEFSGKLNIDPTPTLDQDLETTLLPILANSKTAVKESRQRVTPIRRSPANECPEWHNYTFGFSNSKAELCWEYNNMDKNYFCVNIEYANLTERDLDVIFTINGVEHKASLPPTECESNPWDVFKLITTGVVEIDEANNQTISFKIADGVDINDLDNTSTAKNITIERDKKKLRKFMLNAIILKPLYPQAY